MTAPALREAIITALLETRRRTVGECADAILALVQRYYSSIEANRSTQQQRAEDAEAEITRLRAALAEREAVVAKLLRRLSAHGGPEIGLLMDIGPGSTRDDIYYVDGYNEACADIALELRAAMPAPPPAASAEEG